MSVNVYPPPGVAHSSLTGLSANDHPQYALDAAVDADLAAMTVAIGPWTDVILDGDFTTSSATAQDIGLAFTPAANKQYEIHAKLRLRTADVLVGARPGIAWPTGLTDGTAMIHAGAAAPTIGNIAAPLLATALILGSTTDSWPCILHAELSAGASPSGTFKLQLASGTALTNVTVKAGSFLRYREVA